jgi:uncharacterized membrane protein
LIVLRSLIVLQSLIVLRSLTVLRSLILMMDAISPMKHLLETWIAVLTLGLEAIATLCVFWGLVRTLQALRHLGRQRRFPLLSQPLDFIQIRLTFGLWLALALEFQLGADILNTTVSPSWTALGQLGAIALIRTFLNYFLNQELATETADLSHAQDTSRPPAPDP